jgi:hypothetical protein
MDLATLDYPAMNFATRDPATMDYATLHSPTIDPAKYIPKNGFCHNGATQQWTPQKNTL